MPAAASVCPAVAGARHRCELAHCVPARLCSLFANRSVIADLQALGARIVLMLSDLGEERACVVQLLNRADIPVIAVPLLPPADGYYFTPENTRQAGERYQEWRPGQPATASFGPV